MKDSEIHSPPLPQDFTKIFLDILSLLFLRILSSGFSIIFEVFHTQSQHWAYSGFLFLSGRYSIASSHWDMIFPKEIKEVHRIM